MKIIERAGWIALAAILGPITNEIAFVLLNSRGSGVNVYRAAIPTVAASFVSVFCILKALGFLRRKAPSLSTDPSDATTRTTLHSREARNAPGIAGRTHSETYDQNVNPGDERIWAQALEELGSKDRRLGLWARLYSEAKGDEAAAKAAYLQFRVDELLRTPPTERQPTLHGTAANRLPEDSTNSPSSAIHFDTDNADAENRPQHSKHLSQPASRIIKKPLPVTAIVVTLLILLAAAVFIYSEVRGSRVKKWWQTEQWSERVSILRRKLSAQEIPELRSTLSELNVNSVSTIPVEMVQDLEATQTWWNINDIVFIHLNNTTPFALTGIGISFSEGPCKSSGPAQRLAVSPSTSLGPGQQAVLSFKSHGMRSGCLIIESAWR